MYLIGGSTVELPWITLHFCRIVDTIEARMNEMVDQLARLKADNDSKNAEIQNLKIVVQEKVEVDLTFNCNGGFGAT